MLRCTVVTGVLIGSCVAIQYLNGKILYGLPMRINLSKHAVVQLPREGAEVRETLRVV